MIGDQQDYGYGLNIDTYNRAITGGYTFNGYSLNKNVNKEVPADAAFTDTVYTHQTGAVNKHIPSGGASGQILSGVKIEQLFGENITILHILLEQV